MAISQHNLHVFEQTRQMMAKVFVCRHLEFCIVTSIVLVTFSRVCNIIISTKTVINKLYYDMYLDTYILYNFTCYTFVVLILFCL